LKGLEMGQDFEVCKDAGSGLEDLLARRMKDVYV
jgi:hypothetical protein